MLSASRATQLLTNWATLNRELMKLNESEVMQLLKLETTTSQRRSFVQRLHHRLNHMRFDRERKELGL